MFWNLESRKKEVTQNLEKLNDQPQYRKHNTIYFTEPLKKVQLVVATISGIRGRHGTENRRADT